MIVGIDLGTSNSLVGVWRDGQHVLIPNALGRLLTPSAVSLLENGEIVVGQAARDRVFTHPDRTASAFKRYMGTDRTFTLGRRGFRVEELSALVLAQLKADAEAWLGEPVDEAVVTVPAYFNDKQRKATRAAGEIAGLKVERLLNEPTAAALAYGLDTIRSMAGDAAILVVDLGGGTFDVSILDLFEGVMEVRATAGDNFLGGEDFVDAIVDAFMAEVGRAAGIAGPSADDATGNPAYGLLRRQAELAKRTLSGTDSATLSVPHEGREVSWEITQERFGLLVEPLLQRLRQPLSRALRDARLKPENLTQIVLAGGATRMPAIRRMVAQLFGRLPASHIGPDEVVARGAAVQAGLKARDQALDEIVLTDVAPFSLGIEVTRQDAGRRHQGLFSPILERNTVIPASRVEGYRTVADGQDTIEVSIYQGEARLVRDNIALGSLSVPVPKAKAGEQAIEVRFTYDVSGLLDVEVTVVSTGAVLRKVIEGNAGALNPQEIEAKRASLQALKVHPRDQAENQAVLSRAERLFEENLGWARAQIGEWTDRFVTILERQDPREIAAARQVLSERLAAVDHEPFA